VGRSLEEKSIAVYLSLEEGELFYVGTVDEVLDFLAEVRRAKNSRNN